MIKINFDWSSLAMSWEEIIIIICISVFVVGIVVILNIKNNKRVEKMELNPGDDIQFSVIKGKKPGKVIEDGEMVTIETKVPRHLVYKTKNNVSKKKK